MADPVAAAAAAANDDDVDDLYADLDDHVAAALAAAGESGGSNARDSDPATDREGEVPGADAEANTNEAVDLSDGPAGYSSSDEESEDDLHIVLNEDGGVPSPPPASRCEEGWVEGSEEGEVSGSLVKGPSINDGGRGKFGGLHCKGLIKKTTVPIAGQGDQGHQHAFQKDFYFFLPRNRTVFDINIEAFQQKPWRQPGVDLPDYFNFGLDEEGWRKYCFGMKQFRQGARSLTKESSGLDQESHYNLESIKLMPKSATYSGFEERTDLAKPMGRAIHVEGGVCERLPSADMWRPRQRDSDVVIQVSMMFSPSNHSTSGDSSTVNYKCVTTERISINNPGDQRVKDTSCVVDRVVDKEVHNGDSSDCTGSKLAIRDSACTRDQSSSPDYSDMFSEESTEDCYFKRAHIHSNSNAFYADTKLKDVHVKSDFCHHSSKTERQSSKGDSHSYTPSPTYDRYHKTTKLLRTDGPPFASCGFFINCRSDHRLLQSVHKATREQKWQSSAGGRHAVLEKQEKITDSYPSRYARKYGQKRSCSTSLGNNYYNAAHNQVCEKQDYSPLERVALRNDAECFSDDSNHQRRCSSWHEIKDDEDVVECFSSAKGWQHRHDHGYQYNSMLKAELSDDIDGRMYRERYYQETRRVRHGHGEDDKFLHYTDYRFGKLQGPVVRGKYRNRRRSAESNDEHLRHPDHLVLSPWANDYLKNSEMDWPAAGLTFLSSRNRFIDNKRIRNAKMMQYYRDGDYQKNKHRDSSFRVDNIQQSALYTGAAAETRYSALPVKRKLHADMASMNHKDLVGLSFPKGRRLMHDQSMISDRKLCAAEVHNSSKEIDREAICSFSNMRNSNTISNIYDERRHELVNLQPKDTDSIHLNDRKRKFKRQGNGIRREVKSDKSLPADKDLRSSKHKGVHQKVRKLNRSYHQSGNHDLEKSTFQKRQNVVSINEEDEIEEGELIEQDHQDTVSKSHLNKPRKAVLKSVIEASSAGQLGVINAMPKDAVCNKGATSKCDNKHILEVMEKMQKRRERFKEPITQKEENDGRKEQLAVACSADDIKNQRPARKRRWGGSG